MPAQIYDMEWEQGSTFQWDIDIYECNGVTPLDLSGMLLEGMVRKKYTDTLPTATFTITILDMSNGKIRVGLSSVETAAIPKGRYVYDIELTDATNVVIKLVKGYLIITPEVTKA